MIGQFLKQASGVAVSTDSGTSRKPENDEQMQIEIQTDVLGRITGGVGSSGNPFVDKLPGMVAIYNIKTSRYVYVNSVVRKLLGYEPGEFIRGGLAFASGLVHPQDLPQITEEIRRVLAQANSVGDKNQTEDATVRFEYRMKHKNGSWVWLHTDGSVFSRSRDGNVENVMNLSIDITDRKDLETKAREEYENINRALAHSAIVAITDRSGMILYVNDKFTEISKYPREELIGKTHKVVNSGFHSKDFFRSMWQTILSGKVWHGDIKNRRKDGSFYWVNTTITPRFDENGRIIQFTAIRHDITRRKELERLKDEFIGAASHELRTPVTSLKGYVQVLEKQFKKSGDHKSAVSMQKMDAQINKLNALISDLLDVTRLEAGNLMLRRETFNVSMLIREIVQSVRFAGENNAIDVLGDADVTVYGDRDRIGQVIINLLLNAVKYSPEREKIVVTVASDTDSVITSVRDFGVGIRKDAQKNLFQRFYRVSGSERETYPGLGLGLYISSELVRRHHGRIWVDSTEGEGATFSFLIPRHENNDRPETDGTVQERELYG